MILMLFFAFNPIRNQNLKYLLILLILQNYYLSSNIKSSYKSTFNLCHSSSLGLKKCF